MATGTAPGQWWGETDEVLATVLDVLQRRAEQEQAAAKGGAHRGG